MNGNVSAWAIRHPIPPIVLFIVLTLVGLVAFAGIDIDEGPNVDIPVVDVTITQSGAAPDELETQVTKLVEDAIANIGGIDHISSRVTDGESYTGVEFVLGVNTDRAVNDVRDAITKIRPNLPQTIDEPQIERENVSGGDVAAFAVSAPGMSDTQLGWFVDNEVSRRLLSVKGVGQVIRSGGAAREIRVDLDPARLIALGITVDDVNRQVRAVNANMPGGRATIGSTEQSIRALGSAASVDQLRQTTIILPDHRQARLSDLGSVTDGFAEPRGGASLDAKPVVAFTVDRTSGVSVVAVSDGVDAKIAELQKDHPEVTFHRIYSVADFAKGGYKASMEALALGALLAIAVVFLFLRDMRATLIVGMAMPLSLFPTFFPISVLGFTLNWCSLLALTLVVGILVDDAIVEIENIVRHMNMGKPAYQAALDAADEIGLAVVATTMTIVAVFMPVSLMPGIPGQFFRQFGATVSIAVLFSLLVARLITPMMAAYLGRQHRGRHRVNPLIAPYLRLLAWALDHRWKASAIGVALFICSLGLTALIPPDFLPAEDNALSQLYVELPPGATLDDTRQAVAKIAGIARRDPDVRGVFATIGAPENADVRIASAIILETPRSERSRRQQAIEKDLSEQFRAVPGIRYNFGKGGSAQDLRVILTGDDPAALDQVAEQLVGEMRSVPNLTNVRSTANLLQPELQIRPLYDRASELGVSVADISTTARLATLGEIDANLPKFNLTDRQIPIRVQIDPAARSDLGQIRNLRVATAGGGTVPLDSVAEITMGSGTSLIRRYARERQVTVGADLGGAPLGPATDAVHALPALQHLPPGVHLKDSGDVEIMGELYRGFGFAMAAGILLVLGVMVLLFHSFLQPLTIMAALPLSIAGALGALVLSGDSMSLSVLIGLLMLMGIVTKNAILFVDYAILSMRERGTPRREALLEAGAKRAQPILMTTVAMVAGMAPIALRFGEEADFRAPMAITVIGGLITSTLLSLVFVPVTFTIVDDVQCWIVRRLGHLVEAERTPTVAAE
ncbi:MAG TPA: efflux RND transporter permease subunit [Stellaceae bacterium]|nr:efflux RND transporter permease subunit [Stellaceae bacterium]